MTSQLLSPSHIARKRRAELRSSAPEDFEDFWLDWGAKLLAQPVNCRSVGTEIGDQAKTILIEFPIESGRKVRAWVSGRRHEHQRPRPLLVTSHGYGGQTDPERVRRLSTFGFNVISVDIRGFGMSRGAVESLSPFGWVASGLENPQSSILQGAVADFVNAYRAGLDWFGPPGKVMFQGFSFAGGLALMSAAALALISSGQGSLPFAHPDLLALGAPTFGDWPRRVELCEGGSGAEVAELFRQNRASRAAAMRSLSYFDACFFAPYLGDEMYESASGHSLEMILGVGASDPIVPAETVYAIYNALGTPLELDEFPCSHTDWPEEKQWVRWESRWIRALRS